MTAANMLPPWLAAALREALVSAAGADEAALVDQNQQWLARRTELALRDAEQTRIEHTPRAASAPPTPTAKPPPRAVPAGDDSPRKNAAAALLAGHAPTRSEC